jgi:2-polyprenyl-6-hydroxyphenyl methylase/3-demethylubiquinone-9 3-methyltransferase
LNLPKTENRDTQEQQKFDAIAPGWWDPDGPFRPLHDLNPSRLHYIRKRCELSGARVLDVGCGGGILAESLAACGAHVTALDIAPKVLDVARLHLLESGLMVDYRQSTIEEIAQLNDAEFDVVTCMEMLEHVPDPASVVSSVAQVLKPGGHAFFSTLNRTPVAFLLGIVVAEHIVRILPRGTHRYDRFIRPSELGGWLRDAGMSMKNVSGIHYNPVARFVHLGGHVQVNYIVHAQRLLA